MAKYIHPTTSILGLARCGLANCGTLGIIEQNPIIQPGKPGNVYGETPILTSQPIEETMEIYVILGSRRVYTAKGSLNWSREAGSAVDSCSFSIAIPLTDQRPVSNEKAIVALGSMDNILFRGYTQQIREEYAGGYEDDGTLRCRYSVTCVGIAHVLTRKYVNTTYRNAYAGSILHDIITKRSGYKYEFNNTINKYDLASVITVGRIQQGRFYDEKQLHKMSIMDIAEQLAEESNYVFYIEDSRIYFVPASSMPTTPLSLSTVWEFAPGWDFPRNNYSNLVYEEDGSQVINVVVVHGSGMRDYITYHESEDNWKPIGTSGHGRIQSKPSTPGKYANARQEIAFAPNSTQSSFNTHRSIYDIKEIEVLLKRVVRHEPSTRGSLVFEREEPLPPGEPETVISGLAPIPENTWYQNIRKPASYPASEREPELIEKTDEGSVYTTVHYVRIKGRKTYMGGSPRLTIGYEYDDNDALPSQDERQFWRGIMGMCRAWKSKDDVIASNAKSDVNELPDGISMNDLSENAQSTLSGEFTSYRGTAGRLEPLYMFDIGFGGNSVELNIPFKDADTSERQSWVSKLNSQFDEYPFTVAACTIKFTELVTATYVFTDGQSISRCQQDGTDGAYVMHYENRSLVGQSQAAAYAQGIFNNRSGVKKSFSYDQYLRGLDVIYLGVKPGQRQHIDVRGHNDTLTVESVNYTIMGGNTPIFKANVNLATRPHSVAHILQRALQIKVA